MNKISIGWINGFLGMLIFSGTMPATKVAVMDLDPLFITSTRAIIAAGLGALFLGIFREKLPDRTQISSLFIVAIAVVVGFPMLTALALQHITAAYSTVFLGLLPLSTAIFGLLCAGERPHSAFWIFAGFGSFLVASFASSQGVDTSPLGNIYMIAAVVICGLGYVEGAKLSRTLGGWQVISWALILALPAMIPLSLSTMPETFANVGQSAWIGLIYVSVLSMLLGFVFWYRGLALGGIASVGQLQLLQPFFSLILAATFLHETIGWAMILVTIAVVFCVVAAKKFA